MLSGESKGTITHLIACCLPSARWALVAALAMVLVFSSALSITSYPFHPTHSTCKAPRIPITKAKALSAASERFVSGCRPVPQRLTPKHPSLLSESSSSDDTPSLIFCPLRC